jgi:hypothetical protein
MNLPRYAVAAARLLKRDIDAATPRGDRARGLLTIERAMLVRARRQRALWGLGVSLAVAVAAAALVAWRAPAPPIPSAAALALAEVSPLGSGATLRANGLASPLLAQTPVAAGSTVETASEGGAALQLASRSSLLLERATALRVVASAQTERFALERGAMSAHVAKLDTGRRFIVDTPDAEVEVRGTRFALRVLERPEACGSGSRTRLEVSEGVVEVRASGVVSRVLGGQSWPSGCAALRPNRANEELPPVAAEPASNPAGRSSERPAAHVASSVGTSALTQQNDLFAAGVALRRQGDLSGALRAYQELITQFPHSPLAENAMVERMRLLATTQRALAKQEARRYTQRYPRGFALEEAQRLTEAP